jgi:hypothetical protein
MLALGATLIALAATIAFELRDAVSRPSPIPVASPGYGQGDTTDVATGVSVKTRDDRQVATILGRPLFSPDRRPMEVEGEADAGLGRLTGVMVTEAGKTAIFAGSANEKPLVVREGAHIGRYVIASINADGVTIIGSGGQRVLHPSFDPSPPPVRTTEVSQATPGGTPRFQPGAPRPATQNGNVPFTPVFPAHAGVPPR